MSSLSKIFYGWLIALWLPFSAPGQNLEWELLRSSRLYYEDVPSAIHKDERPFLNLSRGAKVKPIAYYKGLYVQVLTEKGEIGFVEYPNLKEAQVFTLSDTLMLREKPDYDRRVKTSPLMPGQKAWIVKEEEKRFLQIKAEDGSKGWIGVGKIEPDAFDSLPEIEQLASRIIHHKVLAKKTLGKPLAELSEILGPPTGLWYTDASDSSGMVFYEYYLVVRDKKRHKGMWLEFAQNHITAADSLAKGERFFAERLPLAQAFRQVFNFEVLLKSPLYEEPGAGPSWWDKFKDLNWFTWLIGAIVWVLTIVILLAFPALFLLPLYNLLMGREKLSNGALTWIIALMQIVVFYFYILILELQVLYDSAWFPLIGCTLMAWITFQRAMNIMSYHRCEVCHSFRQTEDAGTQYLGKDVSVSKVTRDEYRGSRTAWDGETKVNIQEYERHYDDEVTTTKNYLDHRHCTVCDHRWSIKRSITHTKTIRH